MTFRGVERAVMDATTSIAERVREMAARIAARLDLELVHVEVARGSGRGAVIVRVFIDKPEGVGHEDCARVSYELGATLDAEDFIAAAYTLEVSSPGLERGLYSLDDYRRFAARMAKLKTRQAVGGQRNFRGWIVGVEGEEVIFDDRTSGRVRIAFEMIVKANLEIDVEEEFRLAREREQAALSAAHGKNT
ncbi:MAG: ribosome maturation factor RimP [Pyrinomonadaceae bacterium]